MDIFSRKVRFLIKKSNLSKVLETPPEIVKMKIDYLVSFCDKSQNLWTVFLKNFGEYLRKTFPSEKFSVQVISHMTSAVWRMLDIIKIYFAILAKMAEENRKMIFLYNISIVQTNTDNELTDEFTRNFFNGTSPNMSCLHQESDYGEEINNNNEIIHQYYSCNQFTYHPFSNGL
nr:6869_t:CDS:2 [Entrophospora candida]